MSAPRNRYAILGFTQSRVGPFALLGLPPRPTTEQVVRSACKRQLAIIEAHPWSTTREGRALRAEVEAAARLLMDPTVCGELLEEHRAAQEAATKAKKERAAAAAASPTKSKSVKPTQKPPPSPRKSASSKPERTDPIAAPKPAPAKQHDPPRPSKPSPSHKHSPTPSRRDSSERDRRRSRAAKSASLDSTPKPEPVPQVTRDLMAAWVSAGGWNSRARHRIVAVGAKHGLAGDSLISAILNLPRQMDPATWHTPSVRRVMLGEQSEDAAPTIPRSILRELVMPTPGHATQRWAFEAPREQLERYDARDAQRNFMAVVTTFIICAIVTLPIGLWVLKEIAFPTRRVALTTTNITSPPPNDPTDDATPDPTTAPTLVRTNPMSVTLAGEIDALQRDLLAAPDLDDELLQRLATLGTRARESWITLDANGWQRLADCFATAVYQHGDIHIDAAAIMERMVGTTGSIWLPDEVEARIWNRGITAYLAALPDLPEASMTMLESRLVGHGLPSARARRQEAGLISALTLALESVPRPLTKALDTMPEPARAWLGWRRAMEAIAQAAPATSSEQRDIWLLNAASEILVSGPDVMTFKPALTSLTVLLSQVDWIGASAGRHRVLAWCDDARISAADLSMVTSYLVSQANVPGLDDALVIAPDADAAQRAAKRQQIAALWPADDQGQAVVLARSDLQDWAQRVTQHFDTDVAIHADPSEVMAHLVTLAGWNEAASLLWHGRSHESQDAIEEMDAALANARTAAPANASRPPHTPGSDGQFAVDFARASQNNDRDGLKELMGTLIAHFPDDLGPVDAEFLVDIALTGSPRDVRLTALDVIQRDFANAPNVVLALADNLVPDRRDGRVAQAIETVTGTQLGSVRSESWHRESRLALITHAAQLRGLHDAQTPMAAMADLLAQSYARRSLIVADDPNEAAGLSAAATNPVADARACFEAMYLAAQAMQPRMAVPARLPILEERAKTRAAFFNEPLGAFGAWQHGVLDLMAYMAVAERPESIEAVRQILDVATQEAVASGTALQQLMARERAQSRLWMVRFGLIPDLNDQTRPGLLHVAQQDSAADAPEDLAPWNERLEALSPTDPTGYFLLAEEMADAGATRTATRLFVIAASLDPDRWARSAALALAPLQTDREALVQRARLKALATLLEDEALAADGRAHVEAAQEAFGQSAAMLSSMLGFYRTGEGAKAMAALEFDEATGQLVARYGRSVGSLGQILNFCRNYPRCRECRNNLVIKCPRCYGGSTAGSCVLCHDEDFIICPLCLGEPGEKITYNEVNAMLRLEIALQAGQEAPWDMRFELDGSQPRTVLDPALLPRWFGIDVRRSIYRDGQWVQP